MAKFNPSFGGCSQLKQVCYAIITHVLSIDKEVRGAKLTLLSHVLAELLPPCITRRLRQCGWCRGASSFLLSHFTVSGDYMFWEILSRQAKVTKEKHHHNFPIARTFIIAMSGGWNTIESDAG